MVDLPVHPRLARMVVGARAVGQAWLACLLAALLEDRDVLRGRPDDLPADVGVRLALLDDPGARHPLADGRACTGPATAPATWPGGPGSRPPVRTPPKPGRCWPSPTPTASPRPGAAPGASCCGPGPRGGWRRAIRWPTSRSWPWPRSTGAAATAASAWLRPWPRTSSSPPSATRSSSTPGSSGTATATTSWPASSATSAGCASASPSAAPSRASPPRGPLVDRVRDTGLALLPWTPAARSVQARVGFLHAVVGEPWPDLSDAALRRGLADWLEPLLAGATGRAALDRLDLARTLRGMVPYEVVADLDRLAPEALTVPSGRRVPLRYGDGAPGDPPVLAVRVQQMFGVAETPTVAGGRVPVTLHLLSPADRPVQVTSDLAGFWAGSWHDVRKDMAGRYPKHDWPEHPDRP